MHHYRKKTIRFLLAYVVIFFIAFIASYLSFKKKIAIISIGVGYYTIDMIVMILSLLSIFYAIYEIFAVEHAYEYQERIKTKVK